MKILVADDDQDLRMSLASFLEDGGHAILQAADGQAALDLVAAHRPDLVLLDLRMPRVDGMLALRQLAAEYADLPVIVISGAGQIADAVEAMRTGAWDYLAKPITDLSTLAISIEKVLEKQAMRRQIRAYQEHLEELVAQRTAELEIANQALEQKAIALREVVTMIQEDKLVAQRTIAGRIETTVLPLVQLAIDEAPPTLGVKLRQLEQNLAELTSPFMNQLAQRFASLTPSETRICQLLRRGQSSKDIAKVEGISPDTVDTHRRNIRKKLNIASEQVNLVTFLQSIDSIKP